MAPDSTRLLQRIAANTGRAPPADLVVEVYSWLEAASVPILAGEPVDLVLGLRPAPGARSLSRAYRQSRRDDGLTQLFCLATGSRMDRGERVIEWIDAYQSGDPVPADTVGYLQQVNDAGLRIPVDGSSVARIARAQAGVAPASPGDAACGSITLEVLQTAATSNGK